MSSNACNAQPSLIRKPEPGRGEDFAVRAQPSRSDQGGECTVTVPSRYSYSVKRVKNADNMNSSY